MVINPRFWQDKKVLVTGHTGFKGSWLSLWLQQLGSQIVGVSLEPSTQPNLYQEANIADGMESIIGDICDLNLVHKVFETFQPDIVIHMAAQALVRRSYQEPVETYQTNVMGTMNILEGIRACTSVKSAVMVTSDKCYDNNEWVWPYRENDRLGGHDPYSSSKACAELLIDSYRRSFFSDEGSVAIASVRAGNVIGGGDWSEDRLIPDIVRAKNERKQLKIRNPQAVRPWQHVLEPLNGYLLLCERLFTHKDYAEAWNFGPSDDGFKTVQWIADYFSQNWNGFNWGKDDGTHPHEANILKLDCTKAKEVLDWTPCWTITETVEKVLDWYQSFDNNSDMKKVCLDQIDQFAKDQQN